MIARLGISPSVAPLTYPGQVPDGPAVLLGDSFMLDVHPSPDPVGRWHVDGDEGPLDEFLTRAGAAPIDARQPVLAVGSNASPGQLYGKFTTAEVRPLVPITAVKVRGIIAGVSAHVNSAGYVPATPVAETGAVSDLHVIWLDRAELFAMDGTEPNYHRVRLPAECQVSLPGARGVPDCWVYVSRHGCVVDRSGRPRRLTDQRSLITALIADVPGLSSYLGADPESFVAAAVAASGRASRDHVRALLRAEGLVRPQPEFDSPEFDSGD